MVTGALERRHHRTDCQWLCSPGVSRRHGAGSAQSLRVADHAAAAHEADPVIRVPQYVYYDHDTVLQATEKAELNRAGRSRTRSTSSPMERPPASRRVSTTSLMVPGIEIAFDDGPDV